jgi:hypothetical protein
MDPDEVRPQEAPCVWLYDFSELIRAAEAREGLKRAVGTVNPRPPGWHNDLIQVFKRLLARLLRWHTRPIKEFSTSVSRSMEEAVGALDSLYMTVVALDRMRRAEAQLFREQIRKLQSGATSEVPPVTRFAHDRTAYVIGLFGTGRLYVNDLIKANIGERARYFRDMIRLHPGPTPMIYSGHATNKYISRDQAIPEATRLIQEAVRSGFADSIFIYRHPLDSLLTNWIWWRTYLREGERIPGITHVYKNTDDLCAVLDANFSEFKAFAEGDPHFFAASPGERFLSFAEFVEETELHLQSATLALRLEDFMLQPAREFARIAEVMSVNVDLSRLSVVRPRTKAYGYLALKEKVPRFREFINGLDAVTKKRIETIGFTW